MRWMRFSASDGFPSKRSTNFHWSPRKSCLSPSCCMTLIHNQQVEAILPSPFTLIQTAFPPQTSPYFAFSFSFPALLCCLVQTLGMNSGALAHLSNVKKLKQMWSELSSEQLSWFGCFSRTRICEVCEHEAVWLIRDDGNQWLKVGPMLKTEFDRPAREGCCMQSWAASLLDGWLHVSSADRRRFCRLKTDLTATVSPADTTKGQWEPTRSTASSEAEKRVPHSFPQTEAELNYSMIDLSGIKLQADLPADKPLICINLCPTFY